MAISEIRADEILEKIVKGYLEEGTIPTLDQIAADFDAYIATNDINLPRFSSSEFAVVWKEESSASKHNNTNNTIKEDLDTLFKALYTTTDKSVKLFDRWETKANKLENRIANLEGRIARLLALAADTTGFFDIVGDTFTDTNLIDLDLSQGLNINLGQNLITMAKSTGQSAFVTRVFLNDLTSNQVTFSVLTQTNLVNVNDVDNTEPRFAFYDQNTYWKAHLRTSARVNPVVGDLTVSLAEAIQISKIEIKLHTSESNSLTKITPMYTQDGVNYERVPSVNTVLEAIDKMEFTFPEITANKIKFIIEKNGHDFVSSDGLYVYEFGAREISFYKEAFSDDVSNRGIMISKPLFIKRADDTYVLFNKITLEICEATSSETFIDYFAAVGKEDEDTPKWLTSNGFVTAPDHIVGGVDTRLWTPISPLNRTEITHPQVLDFATISALEKTDIGISYDRDGGDHESPAQNYTLLQQDATGAVIETPCANNAITNLSDRRYFLSKPGHKILDVQIDRATNIDTDNLVLWRNVGEQGTTPGDPTKQVRGVQIGWEFSEPYYTTNIEIDSTGGMTIDVGDNPITIDQVSHTGVIGPDILTQGTHKIKVHKDYWRHIAPGADQLQDLKAIDLLYPYNQKLIIEGYSYGTSYPDNQEQVYVGVDRFAGILAERVGVFDIVNNIADNDFTKYAIDVDAPATSEIVATSADAPLSYVIVVNTRNAVADFMNEKFVLEFNLTDELFSFVALRAELRTTNGQISPVFDEYRIKLAV